VKQITSTPAFLNVFGQKGWQVVRVPLDRLVVWQPIVDAPRDEAAPLGNEEEVVRGFLPEAAITFDYKTTLSRDEQGGFYALLTCEDPRLSVRFDGRVSGAG
jgi:hypothetical protein